MPNDDHKSRLSQLLAEAQGYQSAARASLDAAGLYVDALQLALQQAVEDGVEGSIDAQPAPVAPPSDHRRAHRPGKPRRIDADPELQAFIRARIDRMTYHEIAVEVAAHFPPARRVAKSAIHDWWKRNNPTRRQR